MDALLIIFRLGSLCCLWAGLCFAVYVGLRLFGRRFQLALKCFGSLGLALWVGAFCIIAWLAGVSWMDDEVSTPPYPWVFMVSLGTTLLVTLSVGGWIIRQSTQKALIWWHGVLFCSFYLAAAHLICVFVLGLTGVLARIGSAWVEIVRLVGIAPYDMQVFWLSIILLWVFPLGAPIAEMAFHNFRRVLAANGEGFPA